MSEVFWSRAHKQVGLMAQTGMVVVRPGWVAFLPSEAAKNMLGTVALVAIGGFRFSQRPITYPLEQWWEEGEDSFDTRVSEAALASGGLVLTPSDAQVIPVKRTAHLRFSPAPDTHGTLTFLGRRAPLAMLGAWTHAEAIHDAKQDALLALLCSALPAVGMLVCAIGYFGGAEDRSMIWGVPGWGVFVVAFWAWFFVRLVKSRRGGRKEADARGPYRTA
jgi:hypothetical protein